MVLISLTASIVETILIKTSVYAIEKTAGLVWWVGSSAFNWYYDDNNDKKEKLLFNDNDMIMVEFHKLEDEIKSLKEELHNNNNNK